MKKNMLLSMAVALGAVAVPVVGMAADVPATLVDEDSTVVNLSTVEVVANRANVKTPVAYTNVTKEQLTRNNDGRDIPTLLQMTPSVVSTSDAGAGIGYSSMRVRGTDASRINITANGVPINDGESHVVFWVNMPDLASSLRDIQIQRGVGTSANGAAAFGASVNMITDEPSTERYGELSAAYGSYNTNRETLRLGTGLFGGHWSLDARISHIGSDGYIDRASSQLWSYFGQLAWRNDNTMVRLLAFGGKERTYMAWDYASKEQMEMYGRRFNPCGAIYKVDQYGQPVKDADGNKIIEGYYPDQYDYFTQHHFQLLMNHKFNRNWHLNAALHYTDDYGNYEQFKDKRTLIEYGLSNFYYPVFDADGNLVGSEKVKKQDLVRKKFNDNGFGGGMFTLRYLNDGWDVTFGGSASYFHGSHFGQIAWVRNYEGTINPLQRYYDNTGRKFDTSYYLRANYDINRHLSAFADLQYRYIHYTIKGVSDNYDYNTGAMADLNVHENYNFFNPKAGLNYRIGDHRIFGSWSVAHKEPVRDNFTDGDPNHRPHAERLFDYELGYQYNRSLFSVGVNLYYMDYKDQLVVTGQLSDTGNPLSVNVPDSYRMGVELQGALRPVKWFEWNLSATLSRNRIKNFVEYIYEDEWTNPISFDRGDTPIAFSPSVLVNNSFDFKVKGFEGTLVTRYVSSQYMDNARSAEAKLDAYCVSDMHLGYTFKNVGGVKKLRLGVSVYNLFNKKYFSNGYAGAGYYVDGGQNIIYRYAGYAAQATTHAMGTISLQF